MLQSFIVYSLFAASLWWLGTISAKRERIYQEKGKHISFWVWDVVLALLIFAFISGIRWQVGVDHLSYLESYEQIKRGGEFRGSGVEAGFEYLTKLFAQLNIHFTFYFAFWAFLQLFFIYRAFKDERYLYPFLGMIIILGPHYLSWMNGMRQMLAVTMFVFSIQYIKNRKLIPYFITIFLATLIHKSAILFLIFYFIPQKDYFKNRYINIALVIATLIIGLNPNWMQAFEYIERTLAVIGYDRYAERFDIMVEYRREMAIGPRRISILLLNILTIWYSPKLKQVFKNTNYLIYFNFAFVGVLLYNLFANTDHIFLRPVSYFTIFLALTTAYLLYYLKPQKKYIVSLRFLIVFVVAISYMLLSVIADYGKGDMDWSNFKFFWNYV